MSESISNELIPESLTPDRKLGFVERQVISYIGRITSSMDDEFYVNNFYYRAEGMVSSNLVALEVEESLLEDEYQRATLITSVNIERDAKNPEEVKSLRASRKISGYSLGADMRELYSDEMYDSVTGEKERMSLLGLSWTIRKALKIADQI